MLWAGWPASPPPHPVPLASATLCCPLTSGSLGLPTCPVFLGGRSQLSLGGQCSGQGQQPRGTAAHQASRARGEGHRGGMVGQRLELLLLERGEVGQGQAAAQRCPWPTRPPRASTGSGQRGHPRVCGEARAQASCPPGTPASFSTYWVPGPRGWGLPRAGERQGALTPMRLFSSPTVTCLARSTACSTCC